VQTECPRDDRKGKGYPNLRVATEVFGTFDGTAPQPYIRESRRIVAKTTVRQQDIVVNGRARANLFDDSVGIGSYGLDMHTVDNMAGYPLHGDMTNDKRPSPFQIPLGALISTTFANVLPACKNLGVTHITNSAYRVHPVEWNVGEAAGALAAFCLKHAVAPSNVLSQKRLLRGFQHALLDAGVPLYWWTGHDVSFAAGGDLFAASQLTALNGLITRPQSLPFGSTEPFEDGEYTAADKAFGTALPWPSRTLSRAAAARWLVDHLKL
jgi:hypothetical protein